MKNKSNFKLSTESFKSTPKQIWRKKLMEIRRLFINLKSLNRTSVPGAMGKLYDSINALIDSATNLINAEIKKETGYTIQELKYKCGEGLRLFRQYQSLMRSKKEEIIEKRKTKKEAKKEADYKEKKKAELKEKRQKLKLELIKWLNKQSDEVYNAFMSIQIFITIKELKSRIVHLEGTHLEVFGAFIEDAEVVLEFIGDVSQHAKMSSSFKETLQQAGENIKNTATGVVNNIKADVSNIKDKVEDTVNDTKETLNNLKEDVKDTIVDVKESVTETYESVSNAVTDTYDTVKNSVQSVSDSVQNITHSSITDFQGINQNVLNIEKNIVNSGNPLNVLTDKFNSIADSLSSQHNTNDTNIVADLVDFNDVMKESAQDIKENLNRLRNDLSVDDFLSQMITTGKTEVGNVFVATGNIFVKPLADYLLTTVKILEQLLALLKTIYTILSYYQANKEELRNDTKRKAKAILKINAEKLGLFTTAKYSPSTSELTKSNPPNPFFEDSSVTIAENTQKADMEMMKFVFPVDDTEGVTYFDDKTVTELPIPMNFEMHVPSSDEVHFCNEDESPTFSELQRVNMSLDRNEKICKLNTTYNLVSVSSKTNGGLLKNLQHMGNTRQELITSILDLNGGKRL